MICPVDFKCGNFNVHKQSKKPTKYEQLDIAPLRFKNLFNEKETLAFFNKTILIKFNKTWNYSGKKKNSFKINNPLQTRNLSKCN